MRLASAAVVASRLVHTVLARRAGASAPLPDGPPDNAPPTPAGEDCVYYNTRTASADAYRLCFAHERLASKAIVGGSR
ncbi:hypothetical protein ACSDR0_45825 [Streptosporangium sp. G11]|uniref:hypothetical protein n=1 Tax=Streptosporangium sp. G11 TaxID=3436926 RepID=UPI003EB920E3